jgi:hypothetical protein
MKMDEGYKRLGYAVLKQAIKDYIDAPAERRKKILKDLKSPWMDWLTNGMSLVAAQQLKNNPRRIQAILSKCEEEE